MQNHFLRISCVVIACLLLSASARAGFTNVINVPPNLANSTTISSNTQINVHEGGSVGDFVRLGSNGYPAWWPFNQPNPSSHIELNLYGGSVGDFLRAGSPAGTDSDIVVNLFEGSIGDSFDADGGTTVNVLGGSIGYGFRAGHFPGPFDPPAVTNPVVVNVSGGSIGWSFGLNGVLNMTGGYIGKFSGVNGVLNMTGGYIDYGFSVGSTSPPWYEVPVVNPAVVNLSGGQIGEEFRFVGVLNMSGGVVEGAVGVDKYSVANISSGTINSYLTVDAGGSINLSGGSAGHAIVARSGSQLHISGGDFRLDGVPITGLGTVGNSSAISIPSEGVLTGTLTDGTPLAITGSEAIEGGDYIADGTLTLHASAIPTAILTAFHSPGGPTPRGLRAGQSLTVANGGVIGNSFNASWGSIVTVTGGQVGDNFEAIGAVVSISGGSVGGLSNAFMGSVFNLSGGSIGSNFTAARGSVVNITGGTLGAIFEVQAGGVANVSGGAIEDYFQIFPGGQLNIAGGEFRLNGIPISGLKNVGSSKTIDIPAGAMLSGTFADGTPFAFSDQANDYIAAGTLTLNTTSLPALGPAVIQLPHDPAPKGLRTGQSLFVSEGGVVGQKFTAGWGSSVTISGGQVGDSFKATGAMVNISGGTFDGRFHSAYGSLVNISGGTFNGAFLAEKGSVVNISGGSMDYLVYALGGSVINIDGGYVGRGYVYVYDNSVVNLSSGAIGDYFTLYGGTLNISGGSLGNDVSSYGASAINISGGTWGDRFQSWGSTRLSGGNFRLDGVPVDGLDYNGSDRMLDIPAGSVLSGTLADGTPFAFSERDGDQFAAGMLRLQRWDPPPRGPAIIYLPSVVAPTGLREQQTLIVGPGGRVGDNFTAGWGSTVTVVGGTVGNNFEAVGAQVTIAGGSVGDNFDAFYGSVVNITGGTVGRFLTAHRGSVVNITGGEVGNIITAEGGSVVNVSGGLSAEPYWYELHAAAGSEVHLFGYGFLLDNVPVANLVPGSAMAIDARNVTLSGRLADGSLFAIRLESHGGYYFSSAASLTVTSVLNGDYNGDGIVDASDYIVWRHGLGSVYTENDHNLWRANFGHRFDIVGDEHSDGSIPEPTTCALVMSAAGLVCVASRASFRGQRQGWFGVFSFAELYCAQSGDILRRETELRRAAASCTHRITRI